MPVRSDDVLQVGVGVLTLDELVAIADTVRRTDARPGETAGGPAGMGLDTTEFGLVMAEVERRCGIPLLDGALLCRSPAELVAFVNAQATSGF